jgi:hypothetical protein
MEHPLSDTSAMMTLRSKFQSQIWYSNSSWPSLRTVILSPKVFFIERFWYLHGLFRRLNGILLQYQLDVDKDLWPLWLFVHAGWRADCQHKVSCSPRWAHGPWTISCNSRAKSEHQVHLHVLDPKMWQELWEKMVVCVIFLNIQLVSMKFPILIINLLWSTEAVNL